jgi:hypothetical protein
MCLAKMLNIWTESPSSFHVVLHSERDLYNAEVKHTVCYVNLNVNEGKISGEGRQVRLKQ